jgi:hypothetical protein
VQTRVVQSVKMRFTHKRFDLVTSVNYAVLMQVVLQSIHEPFNGLAGDGCRLLKIDGLTDKDK